MNGVPYPQANEQLDELATRMAALGADDGVAGIFIIVRTEGGYLSKTVVDSEAREAMRSIMLEEALDEGHWDEYYEREQ